MKTAAFKKKDEIIIFFENGDYLRIVTNEKETLFYYKKFEFENDVLHSKDEFINRQIKEGYLFNKKEIANEVLESIGNFILKEIINHIKTEFKKIIIPETKKAETKPFEKKTKTDLFNQ